MPKVLKYFLAMLMSSVLRKPIELEFTKQKVEGTSICFKKDASLSGVLVAGLSRLPELQRAENHAALTVTHRVHRARLAHRWKKCVSVLLGSASTVVLSRSFHQKGHLCFPGRQAAVVLGLLRPTEGEAPSKTEMGGRLEGGVWHGERQTIVQVLVTVRA